MNITSIMSITFLAVPTGWFLLDGVVNIKLIILLTLKRFIFKYYLKVKRFVIF